MKGYLPLAGGDEVLSICTLLLQDIEQDVRFSAGKIHVATDVRAPTSTGTIHPSNAGSEFPFISVSGLCHVKSTTPRLPRTSKEREREGERECA